MEHLKLAVEFIKHIAWPVSAIVIVLLLRRDLGKLIPRIKKGKVAGVEVEFEAEIKALKSKEQPDFKVSSRDLNLAVEDPKGVIIKIWLEVERTAARVFHKHGITYTGTPHTPYLACIEELVKKNLLSDEDASLCRELQMLRNKAIHDGKFSPNPASVIGYIELATGLKNKLNSLLETANKPIKQD